MPTGIPTAPAGTGKNLLLFLGQLLGVIFKTDNLTAEKITNIEGEIQALIQNIEVEIDRVRSFKFNPQWKTRVINIPKALQAYKNLVNLVGIVFGKRLKLLIQPFTDFKAEFIAFQQLQAVPLEPGESRILKGYQELQQFINALNSLVGDIDNAVKEVADITELGDRILHNLKGLDDLFLQQGNPRKRLKGADPRIRLGKIHSTET